MGKINIVETPFTHNKLGRVEQYSLYCTTKLAKIELVSRTGQWNVIMFELTYLN